MKTCLRCRKELDESLFGIRSSTKDGLRTWCKQCEVAANIAYRKTAKGKAALEAYRKKPEVREKMREATSIWLQSDEGREKKRAIENRYQDRIKARKALNWAVRSGKAARLPCLLCGEKAEAHHPDYSLPLAVVWLCDAHHKQVHKEQREHERVAA